MSLPPEMLDQDNRLCTNSHCCALYRTLVDKLMNQMGFNDGHCGVDGLEVDIGGRCLVDDEQFFFWVHSNHRLFLRSSHLYR